MVNLLKEKALDPILETEGVWVEWDELPGVSLKIARDSNVRHQDWLDKKMLPISRKYPAGKVPLPLRQKIAREARAHCILLDWKGFTEDDAETIPVPYSPEKAFEYLSKAPDLDNFVVLQSMEFSLFRHEQLEEERKNLSLVSDGGLSTENRTEATLNGSSSSMQTDTLHDSLQ